MPVLTLVKAVSVALAAGALSFLLGEWRHFKRTFNDNREFSSQAPDKGRLLRRTFGSSILLLMSILMFTGRLPEAGQSDPAQAMGLLYHWFAVLGLALVLAVTALYDGSRSIKRLGNDVSVMEGRELARLAKQLKVQGGDAELLGVDAVATD